MTNKLIVLAVTTVISISCILTTSGLQPTASTKELKVVENSLPFTLAWQKGNILGGDNIAASGHRVFVVDYNSGLDTPSLRAYDVDTGDILWDVPITHHNRGLYCNGMIIVVPVSNQLVAYSVVDGSEVWKVEKFPSEKVRSIQFDENGIEVYSSEFDSAWNHPLMIRTYDDLNGTLLTTSTMYELDNESLLLDLNNEMYWWSMNEVWKTDSNRSNVKWRHSFAGVRLLDFYDVSPAIGNNLLFLTADNYRVLYALDTNNGEQKWFSDEGFASSPTIGKSSIFILAQSGRLLSFNKESGIKNGFIEFDLPKEIELGGNIVITSDEYVIVYFAWQQQLFVFKY